MATEECRQMVDIGADVISEEPPSARTWPGRSARRHGPDKLRKCSTRKCSNRRVLSGRPTQGESIEAALANRQAAARRRWVDSALGVHNRPAPPERDR